MSPSRPSIAQRRLAPLLALLLLLLLLLLLVLLLLAIFLSAVASASAAQERTGRLLVMVDKDTQGQAGPLVRRMGVRTAGPQVPQIGLMAVEPVAGQSLATTAEQLRQQPGVKSVSAERRYELRLIPNDPALSVTDPSAGTPAGVPVQWWAARENLFAAWEVTRGGRARVAIIDSGYDGTHPELSGKIAATFDNQNPALDKGPADVDRNGHGTHISSMACGAGNNGVGIVGAGLDCKLIIGKTDFTDGSIAASLVRSTQLGADAISMSFGSKGTAPATPPIIAGVNYALARDVVLVAAAANEPVEDQGDPANVLQPSGTGPNINFNRGLSVTSADFSGARSAAAGRGTQISIAGFGRFSNGPPGPRGILGAFPANLTELDVGNAAEQLAPCGCAGPVNGQPRYAYLAGTSMATPQVAAIAALVARLNPDLSAAQVIKILKQTATRAPGSGWNPELGWGIVNAGNAVAFARRLDRTPPMSQAKGPRGVRRTTRATLQWTGRERTHLGLVASGLARYELYRSINGARYKRIASTKRKSRKLRLADGGRYRFYTVAVDKRGNRERRPRRADISFRVSRR